MSGKCIQVRRKIPESEIKIRDERIIMDTKKNILLVDDEQMIASTGTQLLKILGYESVAYTSSVEALAYFAQHAAQIDIVITDMTMPGMNGVELAEKILSVSPSIPVILCTGYNEEHTIEKALQTGIRAFLMKPYTSAELSKVLSDVIDNAIA